MSFQFNFFGGDEKDTDDAKESGRKIDNVPEMVNHAIAPLLDDSLGRVNTIRDVHYRTGHTGEFHKNIQNCL